jgi:hypothetical protein
LSRITCWPLLDHEHLAIRHARIDTGRRPENRFDVLAVVVVPEPDVHRRREAQRIEQGFQFPVILRQPFKGRGVPVQDDPPRRARDDVRHDALELRAGVEPAGVLGPFARPHVRVGQ